LAFDLNSKYLNRWPKVIITCNEIGLQRMIGLISLRRRCNGYRSNQPTRIMLGCSMVSGLESDILFVMFGGEVRY